MMRRNRAGIGWMLLMLMLGASAQAEDSLATGDLDQLRRVVSEQRQTIEALQEIIRVQNGRIDEIMARMDGIEEESGKMAAASAGPGWTDKVKLHGNLRYRHEYMDDDRKADTRTRHRIQGRIGLDAEVNDEVDFAFRLASGSDDPVSTNQTLTGAFSSKNVWLDYAYADYHPQAVKGLHLIGGKIKNPWYKPGKTELIWDGDLNPEGIAAKYAQTWEDTSLFLNAGGFWIVENSSDNDSGYFGAQLGLKHNFEAVSVLGGVSYFAYENIKGEPFFISRSGNTDDGSGNYAEDFADFEAFAEVGFQLSEVPITLVGDYVMNTEADGGDDIGWLAGVQINKAKDPGSWQLYYNYRELESDAVVGVFTDSDFGGGGTDVQGHEIGAAYQISRGWQGAVTYFHNEVDLDDEKDYQRLQLDLKYEF